MYVLGTAGHVDHGKSTLVKALTGIDPDRLEEEKRREMTIDLGFAWLTLPDGREVSLIDVPGHERFIKNMLAGVGGIDAALLVVAADEGVMPQTVEHLEILDLLGVRAGVVAITKIDLVEDPEWLELVREEVEERLRGTTLEGSPILPVSAVTGQGLEELVAAIARILDRLPPREVRGRPRLFLDRAFTVAGFGTVVTGTLLDGPLRTGQEVEVLPRGIRARVRGLQSHRRPLEEAGPGRRVAVNLSGVEARELGRGDLLTTPGWLRPTRRLDAWVRVLADAPRPLRHGEVLDLFLGSAEVRARVRILGEEEALAPGRSGYLQLELDAPLATLRGDRYVLRQPSPSLTLAGGWVLDPHPRRHRRRDPQVRQALTALADPDPRRFLGALLAIRGRPLTLLDLEGTVGLETGVLERVLEALTEAGEAVRLGEAWAGRPLAERWLGRVREVLEAYHAAYPLRPGLPEREVAGRARIPSPFALPLVDWGVARGVLSRREGAVALAGFTPQPTAEEAERIRRYLEALEARPAAPPEPEAFGIDEELLAYLVRQGEVTVVEGIPFRSTVLPRLRAQLLEALEAEGPLTVARIRDLWGTTRRYVLALLAWLDREGWTRREGDVRVPGPQARRLPHD